MTLVADTTVDLARLQFATTTIYHFFFVPLTLGLVYWYRNRKATREYLDSARSRT